MTLLLVRFAVIVGGLALLALVVFTIAVALKRRGKLGEARRRAAPVVRGAAQLLDNRDNHGRRPWAGPAMRAAGRYLQERPTDSSDRRDAR